MDDLVLLKIRLKELLNIGANTIDQLNLNYRLYYETVIPFKEYKYENLIDFLSSLNDVVRVVVNANGSVELAAVEDFSIEQKRLDLLTGNDQDETVGGYEIAEHSEPKSLSNFRESFVASSTSSSSRSEENDEPNFIFSFTHDDTFVPSVAVSSKSYCEILINEVIKLKAWRASLNFSNFDSAKVYTRDQLLSLQEIASNAIDTSEMLRKSEVLNSLCRKHFADSPIAFSNSVNSINSSIDSSTTSGDSAEKFGKAPLLKTQNLPPGVVVTQHLWSRIYNILLDHPDGVDDKFLAQEYSKRYGKSLGGKQFFYECHCKNLKDFMFALPDVDIEFKYGTTLIYKYKPGATRAQKYAKQDRHIIQEKKLRKEMEVFVEDETFGDLKLPKQPEELKPPGAVITRATRANIYNLLQKRFSDGVDIVTFTEEYSQTYPTPLNNRTLNTSIPQLFRAMADIIDIGEDEQRRMFIRPKDYSEILRLIQLQEMANRQEVTEDPDTVAVNAVFEDVFASPYAIQANAFRLAEARRQSSLAEAARASATSATNCLDDCVDEICQTRPSATANKPSNCLDDCDDDYLQQQPPRLNNSPDDNRFAIPIIVRVENVVETEMKLLHTSLEKYIEECRDEVNLRVHQIKEFFEFKNARLMNLQPNVNIVDQIIQRPNLFVIVNDSVRVRRSVKIGGISNLRLSLLFTMLVQTDGDIVEDAAYDASFTHLILEKDEQLEVRLSAILDPLDFHVQIDALGPSFTNLMEIMNRFYNDSILSRRYGVPDDLVQSGFVCAGCVESIWCRVVIVNNLSRDDVLIRCIDYGTSKTINRSNLRLLKKDFVNSSVPAMAIKVEMANIKPKSNYEDGFDDLWDSNANKIITDIVDRENVKNTIRVTSVHNSKTSIILTTVLYGRKNERINVNDALVKSGLARVTTPYANSTLPANVENISRSLNKISMSR